MSLEFLWSAVRELEFFFTPLGIMWVGEHQRPTEIPRHSWLMWGFGGLLIGPQDVKYPGCAPHQCRSCRRRRMEEEQKRAHQILRHKDEFCSKQTCFKWALLSFWRDTFSVGIYKRTASFYNLGKKKAVFGCLLQRMPWEGLFRRMCYHGQAVTCFPKQGQLGDGSHLLVVKKRCFFHTYLLKSLQISTMHVNFIVTISKG